MEGTTDTAGDRSMYAWGLFAGMRAHAKGNKRLLERYFADPTNPFDAGFADADDDSDDPRPDDALYTP